MGKQQEITREFSAKDLRALGLPAMCAGGKVHEDRFLDSEEKRGKVSEQRFILFELDDKSIWGCAYTKLADGSVSFDEKTIATRYTWQKVLMQEASRAA